MDIGSKIELVKKGSTQEIVTEGELRQLFETNAHPKHYIGFEISGLVHIATGLLTALKLKDFMAAGIKPTIFLADYHAWLNGKLGGDLEKIEWVGKNYFVKCFECLGLPPEKVDYVFASELYEKMGKDYWRDVMKIAKDTTSKRMLRCTTIMGRTETENLQVAAFLYPAMQAADIWALDVDIAHAGMDQRKVHMLSRELSEKYGVKKAVAVHGRLLGGLKGPKRMDADAQGGGKKQFDGGKNAMMDEITRDALTIENKMSKSNPDSAVFIHDSEEEIMRKMKKAHCPANTVEGNPIIDYAQAFVLRERPLRVERDSKFGGDVEFANADELRMAFSEGKLHPADLKNAVGRELAGMLKPARDYFGGKEGLIEEVRKARE